MPQKSLAELQSFVIARTAEFTHLDPSAVGASSSLLETDMDSFGYFMLLIDLQNLIGRPLPGNIFMQYRSPQAIAKYICDACCEEAA